MEETNTEQPESTNTSGSEAGNEAGYISGGSNEGNNSGAAPSDTEREADAVQGDDDVDQGYAQNDYSGAQMGDGAKTRPSGTGAESGEQDRTTGTGGVAGVSQGSGTEGGYESAGTRDEDYDSGKPKSTNTEAQ